MEFLEVGQKIKKTRKELCMKQKDFEDINITRALISMIEIGKRTLSKENMKIMVEKFRKRAEELNVPFNLESSYFLMSAKEEAQSYCEGIFNHSPIDDNIIMVIQIAKKYGLFKILSEAYLLLADKKFEIFDYINSEVNYINALGNYREVNIYDKVPYIYNMLGRCCINQAQNIQALNYFNLAYHYSLLYNDEIVKKKSIYNIALCNKKLANIEVALNYIDTYISMCDKDKDFLVYVYGVILKANCYDCQCEFSKAIEVLETLLNELSDTSHIVLGNIYNNLGVYYCEQKNYEKSLLCFKKSEEVRINGDMKNLSHTLIEKSTLYSQQELYLESISIIKSAIELAKKFNDTEYIIRGYNELIKIYKILKLSEETKDSYDELLSLLMRGGSENYKEEIIKFGIEYLKVSLLNNEIKELNNILDILGEVSGR